MSWPSTILDAVPGGFKHQVIHPFLNWPGPIAFAHRGGAIDAPENTMEAFEQAIGLGYRYVETDVHATRDGVLMAFHDDDLRRTCGRPGRIGELVHTEVAAARVDGVASIPRFDDLLHTWPDVRFNIDCKSDAAVDGLVAALRRADALDRVCVSSFSERRLRRLVGQLGDGVCWSLSQQGVGRLLSGTLRSTAAGAAQIPVKQGRITVTSPRLVARAHRLGLQVHVWTIDDPAEIHRLLDMGVDGIMTDRPTVLKDVMTSRGCWT
jgi:glycerophosphoryl diester phosphodiesterase